MLLARLAEFHEKSVFSHYFKQFELNAKNNGGRLGVDEFTRYMPMPKHQGKNSQHHVR